MHGSAPLHGGARACALVCIVNGKRTQGLRLLKQYSGKVEKQHSRRPPAVWPTQACRLAARAIVGAVRVDCFNLPSPVCSLARPTSCADLF